jgi:hypothetical protein
MRLLPNCIMDLIVHEWRATNLCKGPNRFFSLWIKGVHLNDCKLLVLLEAGLPRCLVSRQQFFFIRTLIDAKEDMVLATGAAVIDLGPTNLTLHSDITFTIFGLIATNTLPSPCRSESLCSSLDWSLFLVCTQSFGGVTKTHILELPHWLWLSILAE